MYHGASNKVRSRNIKLLMHEGYPRRQAVAIAMRQQRSRRARSNPKSSAWMWVLGGAALGGAGLGGYSLYQKYATNVVASNSAVGVGGGLILGGLLGGVFNRNLRAAATGIIGGAALIGGLWYLTPTPAVGQVVA